MCYSGVEFTLPLAGKDKDAVDSDSEMTSEDDVTANSWLHSMGLPLSSTEHSNNGITLYPITETSLFKLASYCRFLDCF